MTGEMRAYLHAQIDLRKREYLDSVIFCRACGLPKSPGESCSVCQTFRVLRKRANERSRMVARLA